ncbi:MAG: SCP2 sterol-binding domain-containing protein [Proteobacteria bacterium]|nr:SCP2 sterol-binding domain-containing protein [Pseudomonadota bacterium]
MSGTHQRGSPLSPVLLAGLLMRPLPTAPLQPILGAAMRVMRRRHPEAFDRLHELHGALIVIDPVDLPFALAIDFSANDLRVADERDRATATATVHGPLMALIDLIEGRCDGDALFFSRDLTIEGDTEAVVALRNTLDGAAIDIVEDLASSLGPFARPARRIVGDAMRLLGAFADGLETLRQAAVAPLAVRAAGQAARLERLEERIAALEKRARRPRPGRRDAG